jgi:hypothetical protein
MVDPTPAVAQDPAAPAAKPAPVAAGVVEQSKKAATATWTVGIIGLLIDEWGTEYTRIHQGNFTKQSWKAITDGVNARLVEGQELYTQQQCKTKIDGLKARYKDEHNNKTSTANVNSTWMHFEKLASFMSRLPKVNGIPNAKDNSGGASKRISEDEVEHVDLEEEKNAESNTTPEKSGPAEEETPEKECKGEGRASAENTPKEEKKPDISPHTKLLKTEACIKGNRTKESAKRKRESAGDVAKSMDEFTEVYAAMGTNMIQVQRDIAKV